VVDPVVELGDDPGRQSEGRVDESGGEVSGRVSMISLYPLSLSS
jgi:hypothetical protein